MVRFRDYVKQRLDRRYGLTSDVDQIRRDIAGLGERYATADEFDLLRNELNELTARLDGAYRSPATLTPMAPDDDSIRLEVFRSILMSMKPGKLLDLAAGHGKFAKAAQEMGWAVTAVDARTERFPAVDGIDWIQSDLREYTIGEFDVITLLGIFYHLELEDQLDILRRCAGTPTILDTHVALRGEVVEGGYEGRFFSEELPAPTASWINDTSFWPTEESLIRMLHECGYRFIFKLIPPPMRADRTWYICY